MKKTIIIFLFFLCFSLKMLIVPVMANREVLKKGFYQISDLNISQNTNYTVQNTSFSERIYILVFDSYAQPLQGIRLKPQSQKFNLIPLQNGYKIVLIGDGDLVISPNITLN